jgi:hypothetical protein
MTWNIIRLELAGSRDFPRGSVSRAYLIRLPLQEDGSIDVEAFDREPRRATVRRHWPNEPDRSGNLERGAGCYSFAYGKGHDRNRVIFNIGRTPLRAGEQVRITEADGEGLAFRVAQLNRSARL